MDTSLPKFLYWIILSFFVISCGGDKKAKVDENAIPLQIDGSSTVYPLTAAVASQYQKQYGNLNITVSVSGTGGGFEKFANGEIAINNASRKITDQEIAACEVNSISFKEFQVAIDGIAVVVNTENSWVDYLTVEELRSIWKSNGATLWSDVRAGWPSQEIVLYAPGEASGTHDYFGEVILGDSTFREDYKMSENDNLLVSGISNTTNALGFFGLAYFERNQDKLKLVPIDNGTGPITPTLETISAGAYAPLSRPMYIYVSEQFIEQEAGKAFINFYLENAGDLADDVGYVALPQAQNNAMRSSL